MKSKSVYGISRVDNEQSRTHGWLVTIQRRGVIHRKHFSDVKLGGRKRALRAAKDYRDDVVRRHPPYRMQEYSAIRKQNNRSGVVGVCRCAVYRTKDRPSGKQQWCWVASWPLSGGGRRRVKFSVLRYGERGARQRAIDARKKGMEALSGDFNPGANRQRRAKHASQSAA